MMVAVIFLPDFELQSALRPEPELHRRAVALVDAQESKPVVLQVTEAARRDGVCPGLTPTQAMSRLGSIRIQPRSPQREATVTEVLLQTACAFSPRIESTAAGVCTLDLRGVPEAGDERWGCRVVALFRSLHLQAQVGVAATPAVAWQAARVARPFLRVTEATSFLATLPIEHLDPSPEMMDILRRWGIRTAGEFVRLGREHLAERLEAEGLILFERASGDSDRPLRLIHPPENHEERMDFENPLETLEPLLFVLRRFLEQIARRLEAGGCVVAGLTLRLDLASGGFYQHVFEIPAPTRDVNALFRMLHTHLEGLRTPHPIGGLCLGARPCHPVSAQFGLFETAFRDPNRFYETLARLNARMGQDHVGVPVRQKTHRPDAFRMERPDPMAVPSAPLATSASGPPARPSFGPALRRYRPPVQARVQLQGGRPCHLQSIEITEPVTEAVGPWHGSGEWWEASAWRREEWDVSTARKGIYRIYRDKEGWFIEGVYD